MSHTYTLSVNQLLSNQMGKPFIYLNFIRTQYLFPLTIFSNVVLACSNCLKFLRQKQPEKRVNFIYVKDAVEFLNLKSFAVQLGTDKLVAFVPIDMATTSSTTRVAAIRPDTQEIFATGSAPYGSSIFVVSASINCEDFTLRNFAFYFEQLKCGPPIPRIANLNEFRAAMILCKQASICLGAKNQRTQHMGSIVVYPHRGSFCVQCKSVRGKGNIKCQPLPPVIPKMVENPNDVLEESLR